MYFLSQTFPQGLKPGIFLSFAARINPCPFKTGEDAFALQAAPALGPTADGGLLSEFRILKKRGQMAAFGGSRGKSGKTFFRIKKMISFVKNLPMKRLLLRRFGGVPRMFC